MYSVVKASVFTKDILHNHEISNDLLPPLTTERFVHIKCSHCWTVDYQGK